jgi:hypothetical protein
MSGRLQRRVRQLAYGRPAEKSLLGRGRKAFCGSPSISSLASNATGGLGSSPSVPGAGLRSRYRIEISLPGKPRISAQYRRRCFGSRGPRRRG